MNVITKEELISKPRHSLTMGELCEFVYNNPQIPKDAPVMIERVEDTYFNKSEFNGQKLAGWRVLLVEGYQYHSAKQYQLDILQEIEDRKNGKESQYPNMVNPEDHIFEVGDDMKEQFYQPHCIVSDNDNSIVYIYSHY